MKKDSLNIRFKNINIKCEKKFLFIAPLFTISTLMTISLIFWEYLNFINPYIMDSASQSAFFDTLIVNTCTIESLFFLPTRYLCHYLTLGLVIFAVITFLSQVPLAIMLGDYSKLTFKKFYDKIIVKLLKYFQMIICKGMKGVWSCICKALESLLSGIIGTLSIIGIIFAIIPISIAVIALVLSAVIFLGMCVLILIPLLILAIFFATTGIQVFNIIAFYEYCSWEKIKGNLSLELQISDQDLLEEKTEYSQLLLI